MEHGLIINESARDQGCTGARCTPQWRGDGPRGPRDCTGVYNG